MSARSASRFSRSFARVFSCEVLTHRGMIATPKERIRDPPKIAPRTISHGDCPRNDASTKPLATKTIPARVMRIKRGFFHECARVLCVHTAAIPPRTRTAAAISRSPAIPVKAGRQLQGQGPPHPIRPKACASCVGRARAEQFLRPRPAEHVDVRGRFGKCRDRREE